MYVQHDSSIDNKSQQHHKCTDYICTPCTVQSTYVHQVLYRLHRYTLHCTDYIRMYTMYCTDYICTPCTVQTTCVHHVLYRLHVYTMYCTDYICTPCTVHTSCPLPSTVPVPTNIRTPLTVQYRVGSQGIKEQKSHLPKNNPGECNIDWREHQCDDEPSLCRYRYISM